MATKAERYKAAQQRAGKKREATVPKKVRRATASVNESERAAKNAPVALQPGTRKSTRKAKNRSKPDNALQRRQKRRVRSAKARATKSAAR